MNVPRMMRPGMPNPNANSAMINPNNSLRHLLQPQGQVNISYPYGLLVPFHHCWIRFYLMFLVCSILAATTAKSIPTNDGHARDESKYEHEHSTQSAIQRSEFRVHAMRFVASVKLWVSKKSNWILVICCSTNSTWFISISFVINRFRQFFYDFRFLIAKRWKRSSLYLELKV